MRAGTYMSIALRNLVQARRRTLLLSSALGMVSMLLVLLMALSQGVRDMMVDAATSLTCGHVNIGGFYKASSGDAAPVITQVDTLRRVVRETLPDATVVIDRNRGWGKIISPVASVQSGMSGVDIAEERALQERLVLAQERSYRPDGRDQALGDVGALARPDAIVLFAQQAEKLEVTVGDVVTLSAESLRGSINTADVRVVAVVEDVGFMSSFNAFVPKQVLRELYQLNDDTSGAVMVYLEDIARASDAMAELAAALTAAGLDVMEYQGEPFWQKFEQVGSEDWVGQRYDLTVWEDEISYLTWVLGAVESLSFFLVAILLCIIVVGIMNTMWIAVRERTAEIGTLRAIGMQRRQVLVLFLCEAMLLGAAATLVGGGGGALLASLLNAAQIPITAEAVRAVLLDDTLHLAVRPAQVFLAVGVFTACCTLAALWPSLRAARLQPVTAIHRVG